MIHFGSNYVDPYLGTPHMTSNTPDLVHRRIKKFEIQNLVMAYFFFLRVDHFGYKCRPMCLVKSSAGRAKKIDRRPNVEHLV